MKIGLGEFIYIAIFCIAYAMIANVESRLYPIKDSVAIKTRAYAMSEIYRIDREEARQYCEKFALSFQKDTKKAVIWYHNITTNEYWCGFIVINRLTPQRAEQLRPHTTVLNSDTYLRRLLDESGKHSSR